MLPQEPSVANEPGPVPPTTENDGEFQYAVVRDILPPPPPPPPWVVFILPSPPIAENDPEPLITDQLPLPVLGVLAASVTLELQVVWSPPALAAVG